MPSAYDSYKSISLGDLAKMRDYKDWDDRQESSIDLDRLVQKNDELVLLLIESLSINVDNGFQALMSSKLREWYSKTREEAILVGLQNDIEGLGELLRDGCDNNKSMEDMIQEVKIINENFSLYYIIVAALGGRFEDVENAAETFYRQFEDKLNKAFLANLLSKFSD